MAVLVGQPNDPTWAGAIKEAAATMQQVVSEGVSNGLLGAKHLSHRRGDFVALPVGVSFGGGQTVYFSFGLLFSHGPNSSFCSGPRKPRSPETAGTAHQEAEKMFGNNSDYRVSIQCVPYLLPTQRPGSEMIVLGCRCAGCFCAEIVPVYCPYS